MSHDAFSSLSLSSCASCKEQIMEMVNNLERKHGAEITALRERVNTHDILIGDEALKTGMFGVMDRAFSEIKEVGITVREVRDMMLALENQAKGLGFAAKLMWAFIGAGGIFFVTRIVDALK